MQSYVPRNYMTVDQWPASPIESAVQGTLGGMSAVSQLKSEAQKRLESQQNIATAKQNIAKSQQEMQQAEQKFPLDLEKAQADIDKIRDDMTLTPYQKQLYMAQVANQYASAKHQNELAKHVGDVAQQKLLLSPEESEFRKQEAKDFASSIKQTADNADAYDKMESDVDSFVQAYNRIPASLKGSAYNRFAAGAYGLFSGNIAEANKYSSNLIQAIQKLGGKGFRPTDAYRTLLAKGTLTMDTPPEAVDELAQGIKAKTQQERQKVHFQNTLVDMGIRSNAKAEDLWNEYKEKYPALINGKAQPQNFTKWSTFLKEKASGKEGGEESDDTVSVISPTGKTGRIPKGNLDAALKKRYKLNE
jgi:hypothetical protein